MNPSSVFGSSFGQQQSSPFATTAGSSSDTSATFRVNPGFLSSGATSQTFGSANSANTSFGTVSGGAGFGSMPGSDSRPAVFGSPGPGSGSGNTFGSPGLTGFGSGISSSAFGSSTSTTPGFGTGTMSQSTGFGSGSTGGSGSGMLGFNNSTTASSQFATGGAGSQFGSGFNRGTTFGASATPGTESGLAFGTGGSGGTTVFGSESTGFGADSYTMASSGFSTSTHGFSAGSSGFGIGSTGFGAMPNSSSVGAPAFGMSTASGFGGGASVFGSFASAQGASTRLSTAQTPSNPVFGGSSVFGSKVKTPGDGGQGFAISSAVTASCQAGSTSSSAFGSSVSSTAPGFGPGASTAPGFGPGASTSVFGQVPASTGIAGSVTRYSVFGTAGGTSGTGTNSRTTFGLVDKAVASSTSTNTAGNVFGGAQAVSALGAPQLAKDTAQKFSSGGNSSASAPLPPSYSSSIRSGHPGLFAPLSTASVFGDVGRTTSEGGVVFVSAASKGTGEGSVFGGASKASSDAGSVFGGATRTASGESSVFGGASQTSGGGAVFGSTTSKGTGEGSVFGGASKASSDAGSVFGGATRTASGESSVFGGASQTSGGGAVFGSTTSKGTGEGSVFGGASKASSDAGSVFGGASRTASGGSSVFGGASQTSTGGFVIGDASKTAPGESGVFGGAFKSSSGEGSVFGGAGRSIIKQESSQQSNPQRPSATGVSQAPLSVFGSSQPFGGKFPTQKETNLVASSTHASSSASVFGGRTTFPPVFGTSARQPQGTDNTKAETTSSVFGGRQHSEKKEPVQRPSLFPVTASTGVAGSADHVTVKQESERRGEVVEGTTGGDHGSLGRHGPEAEADLSGKRSLPIFRGADVESTAAASVFGGKRSFQKTEAVLGSAQGQKRTVTHDETGEIDAKRGRTEEQEDPNVLATGSGSQGHPSPRRTPEKVKVRRSSSLLEDVSGKTSIVCKGIEANVNKKPTLHKHFSQFGQIERVRPVPSKQYALVQFKTHEAASRAKRHGTILHGQDAPMTIFLRTSTSEKSPVASEDVAAQSRQPFRRPEAAKSRLRKEKGIQQPQLPPILPSSVAAELASMSGADSDIGISGKYSKDRAAVGTGSAREVLSAHRKKTAQQRISRGVTPPPASSSSTSTQPSSSTSSLGKTLNVTVSELRKMVATTAMEKVNVLDTRDKLLRQKIGKQTSGSVHSKAFVGTCPDMCPEKERLYREEVRRLSIYEIIPGSSTLTGSTSLVDHVRAVKEYSRSSADQDEPLPNELRPLPVLTLTMNYLLVEVADSGEDGKWAEWYDFLWNRTRSIRKEITQQQLCSQEVVDLLEKCVRFHIYCSERLCTEDMMVFDFKINDENLTKCLQTLKELYADMENKHGLYCPNEAEFRAYIVLMNLNEGDTLREVQQLRHEVRASAEIGFAVKAYSALYSNNYVRFFRLVQSASFLNACVLHRYFNQIRAQALRIILRSHTAGQKKVGFPLLELQRLLAFEKEEEIQVFCSYYGLQAVGGDLLLDRSAYVEPESSIPSWRAVGLVESKRAKSVGEVINGGPLQPVSLPRPQCSFDEQGRFIGSLEGLVDGQEDQEKVKPFSVKGVAPQLRPSPLQETKPDGSAVPSAADAAVASRQVAVPDEAVDGNKPQQLKPSSEVLKTIARDLFFEVIDQHAREVSESVISSQHMTQQCATEVMSDVTSSVVSDLARQIGAEVVEEERARHDQLLAAERREREARVMAEIVVSVIDNGVEEQAKGIALEEMEEAEAREQEERQERCTLLVQSELLREVTEEMAMDVADDVHQVDVVARLQLLNDLQKAVELKRTAQWLAVWRKALKIRQRQKRAMLDFPCAPPMHSASQRLQSMYLDRPEHASPVMEGTPSLMINSRAKMTLLSPLESAQRSLLLTGCLSLKFLFNTHQRKCSWEPLKLASLLKTPLNQAVRQWPRCLVKELTPQTVQWKLLLSLPGEEEEPDKDDDDSMTRGTYTNEPLMPVVKRWLCDKFTHGDTGASDKGDSSSKTLLSQYSIEIDSTSRSPPKLRVGVCVRNVPEFGQRRKGKEADKEQSLSLTKGTSAIMFLLPHADTTDETVWLAARLRLARLLEAKPFLPATPLALLLPCGLDTQPGSFNDEVTRRLAVQKFQDQDLVSDVAVVELAIQSGQPPDVAVTAPVLQTQLSEAVKFLASKAPEPPDLRCERLGDLVEDLVNQHFFTPVLQDLKLRLHLHKLHQAPNTLIGLYNSVLDHICQALTSPALQDFSWPAPELQLSAGTREDWNSKKHLGDIYELVSSLRLPWFHYKDSSSAEWSQVCHDVWTFVNSVVKKRCDSAVSLTSRISRVLAHTCMQFENICSLTQNEDHCTPTYVNAPWTDIVVSCAEFRLQRLHNWKDEEEDVGGDLEVLFEGEDLEEFEPPAPWIQALLDTEDAESRRMEETVEHASILHCASQPAAVEQDTFTTSSIFAKPGDHDDWKTGASPVTNEPHKSDLPENIRSALETSEKLRLHVEEERRKSQAFERYLEKALQGDTTSPDMGLSATFQSATSTPRFVPTPSATSTPRFVPTPYATSTLRFVSPLALTSAGTPLRPLSTVRQDRMSALTPGGPGTRGANLTVRYNLEPRRLVAEPRTDRSAAEVDADDEAGGVGQKQSLPLHEGIEQFKENLQAQRYANELFEKRLRSLLES